MSERHVVVFNTVMPPIQSEEKSDYHQSESEALRAELLHFKEKANVQEILRNKSEQKLASLKITLQEVIAAQGSMIAFFTERLEEEKIARVKLKSENSSLVAKLKKFQNVYLPSSMIWPYKVVKEKPSEEKLHEDYEDLSEDAECSEKLSDQEAIIYNLKEQLRKKTKLANDIENVMTYTVKQLEDAKRKVDGLQQQLDERENELKEVTTRFEEEKCTKKELQSKNFNLNEKLKELENDFALLESSNHKVIREKKTAEEKLDAVSGALAEEEKKSKELNEINKKQKVVIADLKVLLKKEKPVTEDFEIIQDLMEAELNNAKKKLKEREDQLDKLQQHLNKRENVLNLVRSELEKKEDAIKELELQSLTLNSRIDRLTKDLAALQINNKKIFKEKTSLEEKLAGASRALVAGQERAKHFIDVKTYQEVTIDDLKEQLKIEKQRYAYLERVKSSLETEKSKMANQLNALSLTIQESEKKRKLLETEFEFLAVDTKCDLKHCRELLQEDTLQESISNSPKK